MPDMVKVINAITLCTTQFDDSVMVAPCKQCPYYTGRAICDIRQMMLDTLELLKEQEEQISRKTENFNRLVAKVGVMPKIVRCGECMHHGKDTCSAAGGITYPPPNSWFCADGERSE